MPRAYLLIRREPHYRRDSFEQGLTRCGFEIAGEPRTIPNPDDVLVIWNRYGRYHTHALAFERAGAAVIVAENGPLGRDWRGEPWYSVTLTNPFAGGRWPQGGPERWDSLGAEICEWRNDGREVIILAQRGIGPPGVRQPDGWERQINERVSRLSKHPIRMRSHPGERPCVPLEDDLKNALCVVTWASGAAIKCLLWGIPVLYGYTQWIGKAMGALLDPEQPLESQIRRPPDRLEHFRRLSWAMWRTPEIESGEPFHRLLAFRSTESKITTAAR